MSAFRWKKEGLIYNLDGRVRGAVSHAQIPTIDINGKKGIDVFFSTRDAENHSFIARLNLSPSNLNRVIHVQENAVLERGVLGAFDDCGVMPSSIVQYGNLKYLYYIGWNVHRTIPYHNSVGLAVSEDGGETYRRKFIGPVMDRTADEPYFCATTCVRIENGIWRNWYLSCTEWRMVHGVAEPRYHLKYAESLDGIHWERKGIIAIDYKDVDEGGIVRASVIKDGDLYRMWFCYRSVVDYRSDENRSYRIGYAESGDGISWRRLDASSGIDVSESGWDSFMLAYPEVFECNRQLYMLYNGNGFGVTGFGLAQLERSSS